jgi:hypothetical protein
VIGDCGLCHLRRDLRDSHFLPKAVYRMAREPGAENQDPVVVTPARAGNTSQQVKDRFLCAECEDRFSRNGEAYVLGEIARPNGDFRLRERLQAAPLVGRYKRRECRDVSHSQDIRRDQFAYFAASLLWRAGAREWKFNGLVFRRIQLGPYLEGLRLFLLSDGVLPPQIRFFVSVWTDDPLFFTSIAPTSSRPEGTWRHKFCVPGVTFTCFVGGEVPEKHDAGSLNGDLGQFMWLSRFEDDPLYRGFAALATKPTS